MFAGFLAASNSFAAETVHWGYSGNEGPEHWEKLAPEFALCSSGRNQSPVNLTAMIEGELPELEIDYKSAGNEITNNGHTVQVTYAPGSTMAVAGKAFELKQFHFHSPSENIIEGNSYPMEVHFVHADEAGNLAVIAVMFKIGKHNAELEKAWEFMPHKAGESSRLRNVVDANLLLPDDRAYYRFNGSLTTPPCSEGVSWFVMKSIDTASKEQIEKFAHTMHHDNNRPVQSLNSRVIVE